MVRHFQVLQIQRPPEVHKMMRLAGQTLYSEGALNLQDLEMTDHKKTMTGKCKTWEMTDQIAALEIARPGK